MSNDTKVKGMKDAITKERNKRSELELAREEIASLKSENEALKKEIQLLKTKLQLNKRINKS